MNAHSDEWHAGDARDAARPTVLFVINDLRMGGAERALVNYVNHLERVRPVVVLISPEVELVDELNDNVALRSLAARGGARVPAMRVYVHRPRGRPRGQMLLEIPGLLLRAWRLARLARASDARVVSTFLNRSHTVAMLAKLLFAPRLRIVINVHEMLSQHLGIYFAGLEHRLMRAFIRLTFPLADRVVAVSEGVRQDLVSYFGIAAEHIVVLHNPIDVVRIRKASEEEPVVTANGGLALIVGVGRLVKLKGFDVLIRAVARLPNPRRARLQLIGEGEERERLEHLASELNVADRVELLGMQTNPWKYMARADVIAMSSRTEAFPNVIGEALALARPVVATLCSHGVTEYLDGGRCGLLVPPDDVDAMVGAIERLLEDAHLRRDLAERGSARVATLDLPVTVERYERVITEAATDPRS